MEQARTLGHTEHTLQADRRKPDGRPILWLPENPDKGDMDRTIFGFEWALREAGLSKRKARLVSRALVIGGLAGIVILWSMGK